MTWLHYLLLVNLYLIVFYGFYALLLKGETFFQLNRIYLIGAALLSFFIPMIQANWVKNLFITQKVENAITVYKLPVLFYQAKPLPDAALSLGQLLAVIYSCGILFLSLRLVVQLIGLKKVLKQVSSPVAYSFFKKVHAGTDEAGAEVITAHEKAHAAQWHSLDVLLVEAVMIINWFNPVVYLYRIAIKHIHEFIADNEVISTGTDKADYALLLLNQTFNAPPHSLVNPFFNQSFLKKRIMMLQKSRSQRIVLLKYVLSAPLFALMLVLSAATVDNSKLVKHVNVKVENLLLTPANKLADVIIDPPSAKSAIQTEALTLTLDTSIYKKGPIFSSVEHPPQFPGGERGLMNFLAKNLRYPQVMRVNNVHGKVWASFIVEKDGSLSHVQTSTEMAYPEEANNEVKRVFSLSPRWAQGFQNGNAVRVKMVMPIMFSLADEEPTPGGAPLMSGQDTVGKVYNGDTIKNMPTVVGYHSATDTNHHVIGFFRLDGGNIYGNTPAALQPLIIIDGTETTYTAMQLLDPVTIESISVLKDKAARVTYGPKADNGVILITTKKAKATKK